MWFINNGFPLGLGGWLADPLKPCYVCGKMPLVQPSRRAADGKWVIRHSTTDFCVGDQPHEDAETVRG